MSDLKLKVIWATDARWSVWPEPTDSVIHELCEEDLIGADLIEWTFNKLTTLAEGSRFHLIPPGGESPTDKYPDKDNEHWVMFIDNDYD